MDLYTKRANQAFFQALTDAGSAASSGFQGEEAPGLAPTLLAADLQLRPLPSITGVARFELSLVTQLSLYTWQAGGAVWEGPT